jgi:hypothetical protein
MDEHPGPTKYVIRIRGVLSDRLLIAFPGLRARRDRGDTELTGALPDQAALHGVLAQIEALGLELIEVRRSGRGESRREPRSRAERRSPAERGNRSDRTTQAHPDGR